MILIKPLSLAVVLVLGSVTTWLSGLSHAQYKPNIFSFREAIEQGRSEEYLAAMEEGAARAEKAGQLPAANRYNLMASVAARKAGQLRKAMAHAEKSFELGQTLGNPALQATAALHIGQTLVGFRSYHEARQWLEKGMEVTRSIQQPPVRNNLESQLLRALGVIDLQQDSVDQGIRRLSRALELVEGNVDVPGRRARRRQEVINTRHQQQRAQLLALLGRAYWRAGNLEKALEIFERGRKVIRDGGLDDFDAAWMLNGMGMVFMARQDFDQAHRYLTESLAIAEKLDQQVIAYRDHGALARIYLRTRQPAKAVPHYARAIEIIESLRSLFDTAEFRESFVEDKLPIYGGMILAQVRTGNFEEAFNYSERARARAFLDLLGSKVQLGRSRALVDEERAFQEKLAAIRTAIEELDDGRAPTGGWRQAIIELQNAYGAFLAKVRRENPEQSSLMNVEPLKLKEVQQLLQPGQTMLEYFVGAERSFLWIVDRDTMEVVPLQFPREEVVQKVSLLRQAIAQLKPLDEYKRLAQELYRMLVEPARRHIRGKELVIVPHDVLHYLPFQALYGDEGKYLIEQYPLSYLSSASLLKFTKEKRKAARERVLALANPDLGDPKKNLDFAEVEAREVKTAYPHSTLLLKSEATEEKGKQLSPQYDILHFATHGDLKEADPLSSALLLARGGRDDGRLEVREIFGLNLRSSLVVLSGCETGLGKLSTGDELVGLTRAFIYAGTPSVIASLWKVDDRATADLMGSFYKHLTSKSKVEALRQAQRELIRANGSSDLLARRGVGGVGKLGQTPAPKSQGEAVSTSHPYFWAPFVLVGDGA
jgi:CHAT domain-containing protein